MHYDRPGPGVNPDTPRKKGAARFFEVLGRDLGAFWCAGMLALLSALPFILGLGLSLATHAIFPMLLAGALGGMIAAPQLTGLHDTILRSLRDEPGYWWATYRRVWKRNAKGSLLPGAVCGLILGMQVFSAWHMATNQGGMLSVLLIGLILLGGLAQYIFAQVALLDMPFPSLLKNAVLLFFGYLPRTLLGVLWQGLYWGAIVLFFPLSVPVLLATSFWLPAVLSLMAIYPPLEKSFNIEETLRKMRVDEMGGH